MSTPNLNTHQPLAALQTSLQVKGERLKFQIGQSLSEESYLPGHVLLIESGTARLLGSSEGRLTTRAKLESGAVIGAASLLRGQSCEAVRAATELLAWSITDETFQQIFNAEKDVRECCESYLWEAEITALIDGILERTPASHHSLEAWLKVLQPQARLITANDDEAKTAFNNGKRIFLASSIANNKIDSELKSVEAVRDLLNYQTGFPLRLIALPADQLDNLHFHKHLHHHLLI